MKRLLALRGFWPASVLCAALLATAPLAGQDLQPQPYDTAVVRVSAEVPADAPMEYTATAASEMESVLHRLEVLEQDAAKATAEKAKEKKPDDGWTDLSSEKWTVKLGGHVQMDYIQWPYADPPILPSNYFEFRRLRLTADGTGYGVYDFRLQIDIEPESGDGVIAPVVDVKDAYFSINELPLVSRWRIGNFFVPFSLEQVTNDTNNIFLERSIPTQGIFAADREVGMAVYGVREDKNATWTVGVFFDNISESRKERIDARQGTRVSGRLTWLPFYDEASNGRYLIHTGAGVLYTDDFDDLVRVRARPQIHEGPFLIDSGTLAANTFTTGNLEFATVWGPVSVQSELFASSINMEDGQTPTLYGGYVYGSYFLTGENRIYERYGQHGAQFARNVPFSNFFIVPGGCGPGAWEVKARIAYLGMKEIDRGQYNDLTLGLNWYWSDRVRVMFDYIHPVTSVDTPFGNTQSDILGMRFDFNW
jgi:phosphate-selective porin OprO/OprP